jgi:hypothetical protein
LFSNLLLQFLGKFFGSCRASQVNDDITEDVVTTLPAWEAPPHKEFTAMDITSRADTDCDSKVYCDVNKSEVALNTDQNTSKSLAIFKVFNFSVKFHYFSSIRNSTFTKINVKG